MRSNRGECPLHSNRPIRFVIESDRVLLLGVRSHNFFCATAPCAHCVSLNSSQSDFQSQMKTYFPLKKLSLLSLLLFQSKSKYLNCLHADLCSGSHVYDSSRFLSTSCFLTWPPLQSKVNIPGKCSGGLARLPQRPGWRRASRRRRFISSSTRPGFVLSSHRSLHVKQVALSASSRETNADERAADGPPAQSGLFRLLGARYHQRRVGIHANSVG